MTKGIKMKSRLSKGGFMLLEVLLVVVILSGSLVMVINSLTASVRSSALSEDYTLTALALESMMFRVLTGRVSSVNEDYCENFARHQCRVVLEDSLLNEDDENARLKDAEVKVVWPMGKRRKQVTVVTCVFAAEGG